MLAAHPTHRCKPVKSITPNPELFRDRIPQHGSIFGPAPGHTSPSDRPKPWAKRSIYVTFGYHWVLLGCYCALLMHHYLRRCKEIRAMVPRRADLTSITNASKSAQRSPDAPLGSIGASLATQIMQFRAAVPQSAQRSPDAPMYIRPCFFTESPPLKGGWGVEP